jgi:hypothetical protein
MPVPPPYTPAEMASTRGAGWGGAPSLAPALGDQVDISVTEADSAPFELDLEGAVRVRGAGLV